MGMYTEFVFAAEVNPAVVPILEYMLREDQTEDNKPSGLDHDLFQTDRWQVMFKCDSFYFNGDTHSTLRYCVLSKSHFLTVRCNLKNYDDEIEKFVDWLTPYIVGDNGCGSFLGYKRYEETERPTLLFHPGRWERA